MNKKGEWLVLLGVLFVSLPCLLGAEGRPNFVFILGEGHGWSSTSVQMDDAVVDSRSRVARTPNLEKLAQAGMRFSAFRAPSPRCTPSRVAFLTGKSPAQLHMTFINEGKKDGSSTGSYRVVCPAASTELPTRERTIAALLKDTGYATAHFGKWHMGRTDPGRFGFDASDGPTNNGGPDNVENPHPKELYGMTQRGMEFMSRQVSAGKPFYLQLSHYASRHGGDALPATLATVKSWGGSLSERELGEAAADLDLDLALGQLLQKIEELKIKKNTYVIFTTDHGTPGRNSPLAGGKGTVLEGGLRVPFIIRGPGIKPGSCSSVLTIGEDLFPTLAELAGVRGELPDGVEGGSLVPLLKNGGPGTVKRAREEFVVHFPHYDKDALGPASTILLGDYKLIRTYETNKCYLYNLAQDPGERRDLAATMPEKARELNQRLSDYLLAVKAQMPTIDPRIEPGKAPEMQGDHRGQGKGKGPGKGKNKDRGRRNEP